MIARRAGPARLDLNLDRQGKSWGAMRLPWSDDRSAYGQIAIPIAVINNGEGPTALLTGGVHGDEYEGQIVLASLARNLDPAAIRGRIIIVPCANPPASQAGRRTSPLDNGNLARVFPGDPAGGPTSQIAEGMTRLLLAEADFLVDFHSGGSTLDYLPCAFGRLPSDLKLATRVLDLLVAFGAPQTAIMLRPDASGTLVSTALEHGVAAMATELGGSGGVTADTLAIAERGVMRTLAHMGVLDLDAAPATSRLLAIESDHFVRAPGRGLFEPAFMLGQRVERGDLAGRLSVPDRPDREPEDIFFAAGGTVLCRRVPTLCEAGDVLVHLGEDIDRETLLSQ